MLAQYKNPKEFGHLAQQLAVLAYLASNISEASKSSLVSDAKD